MSEVDRPRPTTNDVCVICDKAYKPYGESDLFRCQAPAWAQTGSHFPLRGYKGHGTDLCSALVCEDHTHFINGGVPIYTYCIKCFPFIHIPPGMTLTGEVRQRIASLTTHAAQKVWEHNEALQALNAELTETIAALNARIAELEGGGGKRKRADAQLIF